MSDIREIELAIEHFASNQEFIRLYNRHNRELLLQHFLLIAAAGDEVWRMNQERKMSMSEQRDQMLIKYMEWLERMGTEFPEVQRPADVNEDWWRLMLLAYERKPISGKSLWRKFKEDTRNPILSSFNCHWTEPREHETLEDRFRQVRRGVWRDLGHRDDEFLPEGTWLPKQWYAWRYCCYPGKNFRAFDGKLPSVGLGGAGRHRSNTGTASGAGRLISGNEAAVSWAASIPIEIQQMHDAAAHSSLLMNSSQGHRSHTSTANSTSGTVRINRSTLPTTVANQRLLAAAASMARVRVTPDDELSVQQYLADVQQYTAQMARLEKAVALAESFGDHEKAIGFKRQLYEHVQSEPPQRLKRAALDGSQGLSMTSSSYDHSSGSGSGTAMSSEQNGLLLGMPDGAHLGGMHQDHAAAYAAMPALSAADGMDGNGSVSTSSSSNNSVQGMH
jgi:hypothetical protein